MKSRVVCLADVSLFPEVLDPLREVADVEVFPQTREAMLREIPTADAYLACLAVRVDEEVLSHAEKLRAISTPSTGTDHIDLDLCAERGIEVISIKHDREFLDKITCTAELGFGLLLALVRKIPSGFEAAKRGHWARNEFRGHQLSGKTFGILGYGRLGTIMARFAKGFGMRVLACDIKDFQAEGVERVDHETLYRESDVLSIHIHLTPENTGLIGRDVLAMMKPEAVLINTSRGAIIDEAALVEALESGSIAGAGTDVIHGEWCDVLVNHPLIAYAREHDNLIISPHVGGVTYESQSMSYRHTATKLRDWLQAHPA